VLEPSNPEACLLSRDKTFAAELLCLQAALSLIAAVAITYHKLDIAMSMDFPLNVDRSSSSFRNWQLSALRRGELEQGLLVQGVSEDLCDGWSFGPDIH
jgi:hypothetical protein